MMLVCGRICLVRPSAIIITHKKWKFQLIFEDCFHKKRKGKRIYKKCSGNAVYRALFLTGDYNTKSQRSKKLLRKSELYKVPYQHDAWNCKNGRAWAPAAIITIKK
jgi:hypothetical protein